MALEQDQHGTVLDEARIHHRVYGNIPAILADAAQTGLARAPATPGNVGNDGSPGTPNALHGTGLARRNSATVMPSRRHIAWAKSDAARIQPCLNTPIQ